MSISFVMESVSGRTKADAKVVARYQLESRFLIDFASAVRDEGLDEPEGASLDWVDALDWNDTVAPRSCHAPPGIIAGLLWLRDLAQSGEDPAEAVWQEHFSEPFSPKIFAAALERDMDRLLKFCQEARDRKDKLIGRYV
jgi:hypothetical protein